MDTTDGIPVPSLEGDRIKNSENSQEASNLIYPLLIHILDLPPHFQLSEVSSGTPSVIMSQHPSPEGNFRNFWGPHFNGFI